MITHEELKSEVLANLELGSSDATRFKVFESLNSAQLTLLNILPIEYLKNAVKTAKFNLVNGNARYQWPDDFIRIVQMWISYSAGISSAAPGREASLYNPEETIVPIGRLASANFPFYDIHTEGGFELQPIPSLDLTAGGRLRYVYQLPAISETDDQDSLLEADLKNLLIWRATALSCMVDNYNPQRAAQYEKLYQQELQSFKPKGEVR